MSTVKTIDELFQSIDICVDEMKDKIKKLTRDYNQYIVRKSKKVSSAVNASTAPLAAKVSQKTIAEIERQNDTICVTILKTGKRCTKKRAEEGPDTELCKLHNNPKFSTLERYDYGLKAANAVDGDNKTQQGVEQSDDESSSSSGGGGGDDDAFVEVKLTVDADGDTIDQEGNIWCLEKQYIKGKKDLRTKHKVYFKTV
jgi:hypothetical protein